MLVKNTQELGARAGAGSAFSFLQFCSLLLIETHKLHPAAPFVEAPDVLLLARDGRHGGWLDLVRRAPATDGGKASASAAP